MKRRALSLAAAITISGVAPDAHHSITGLYDTSRQVTVEGNVAQFQLVNPHPFLLVDVKDRSGKAQQWRLEMDNRGELVAIGVTASFFKPGDRVVATGSPGRTQPQTLYVRRLDRPADGLWYEQIGSSPRIRPSPR